MSSYGRNFEFRVPPVPDHRASRYITPVDALLVIGTPVKVVATAADAQGRLEVVAATGVTTPRNGISGILVYEHAPSAFSGQDAVLTTFSDLDKAPFSAPVQLVSGSEVKVVLRNTEILNFYGQRTYPARTMVAGMGATPTLAVGDLLRPGVGSDAAGYWTETSTAADGWLVVTNVDAARGEVEARMLF